MTKKITIGSRGSKLALLYAQKAKDTIIKNTNLSDVEVVIKTIITKGDQFHDKRLSEFGGKGLFSNNIEKELCDKTKKVFQDINWDCNIERIYHNENQGLKNIFNS